MSDTLSTNAYHTLGLNTSADRKEIARRTKEISHRLRADDEPQYPLDMDIFTDFRNKSSIKDAAQALANPKKRIREFFFWFQITDDIDEQAAEALSQNKYESALMIWKDPANGKGAKAWFYKKNLALLYTLLLFKENNETYLEQSLELWKEIMESDKFWSAFAKVYQLHDDLGVSDELVDEFRQNAPKLLADVYTEISERHDERHYIAAFSQAFSVKGEKVEKQILGPIYQKLQDAVVNLENLNASEDGILDAKEIETIKMLVKQIQTEINRLIDLGLYDDSQSKLIRDRAAEAIKTVSIDLYNKLGETERALGLMNIALNISGTAGLQNLIQSDIKKAKQDQQLEVIIKPVTQLLHVKKYGKALNLTNQLLSKYKNDPNVIKNLNTWKKICVRNLAIQKHQAGNDYLNAERNDEAKELFNEAGRLINENLDLFNIEKTAIDTLITTVTQQLYQVNLKSLDQIDYIRDSVIQIAKENFAEQDEEIILIILLDAHIYKRAVDLIKRMRHKSSVTNILTVLGWLTIWIYGIGLIFFLASWLYNNYEPQE